MTTTKKKTYQSTEMKIISVAKKLFAGKGFAGTSISDLAKAAEINQSLIYHYFENKEALWRRVKHDVLIQYFNIDNLSSWSDSVTLDFNDFLTQLVTQRFEFYDKNPEIRRMIAWQRLEKENQELNIAGEWRSILVTIIKKYQAKGQVRTDFDADLIVILILTTSASLFLDSHAILTKANKSQRERLKRSYLDMVLTSLLTTLSPIV